MKLEWDFSELTRFADNLSNLTNFEKSMQDATKRLARALLTWMKKFTPTETYELISGWEGNDFAVRRIENGFEVLVVNKTPYATAVNDGHQSYNQHGGPYEIHDEVSIGPFGKLRGRIKVTSPHQWQKYPKNDSNYYVFGHFFVERGILQLNDSQQVEQIIMEELRKWWDSL